MRLALASLLLLLPVSAFAAETSDQAAYRTTLDRSFLNAGINLKVEVVLDPKLFRDAQLKPPTLLFSGPINRPVVYQIQEKLDVLGGARKAAFNSVVFWSFSGAGMYGFDISKQGQTCSRDLCF